MAWLLFSVVTFTVLIIVSAVKNDWNATVIALFAQFYFLNQMRRERN